MDILQELNKSNGRERFAQELRERGYNSKADRFIDCKTDKILVSCKDCGHVLTSYKTCQLAVCPKCNEIKRARTVERYQSIVKCLNYAKQLDVTVKNIDNLTYDHVRDLRDSFHELRERLPIAGGIYSIEITNKGKGWNLHIHSVVDMPYIDQERISDIWESITGDPVVYIQNVGSNDGNLKEALYYITKYVTKCPNLQNLSQAAEYIDVLNNKRLLSTFGSLYAENVDELTTECPNCGGNDFEWLGSMSYYAQYDPLNLEPPPPT